MMSSCYEYAVQGSTEIVVLGNYTGPLLLPRSTPHTPPKRRPRMTAPNPAIITIGGSMDLIWEPPTAQKAIGITTSTRMGMKRGPSLRSLLALASRVQTLSPKMPSRLNGNTSIEINELIAITGASNTPISAPSTAPCTSWGIARPAWATAATKATPPNMPASIPNHRGAELPDPRAPVANGPINSCRHRGHGCCAAATKLWTPTFPPHD